MESSKVIEEINATRLKITISVPHSEVKAAFEGAVVAVKNTSSLKGFRPGKAPEGLVRKAYENDIRKKAYEQIVEASYSSAIKDIDFQIVSYPNIEPEAELSESSEFKYVATVDINPKVTIVDYKGLKLNQSPVNSDVNAQLELTLKRLAQERGTFVAYPADHLSASGDYIQLSCKATLDGSNIKNFDLKDGKILLNGKNIADLEAGLTGCHAGQKKEFPVTMPADFSDATVAGKTLHFVCHIKAIEFLNEKTIDDGFAKSLGAESLEKLNEGLRSTIQSRIEADNVAFYRPQIIDQILALNAFDVPESLVDGTIDKAISDSNANRKKSEQLNPENAEVRAQFSAWALKEVKGFLALGHIAREEGVTVDDNEVSKEMLEFASLTGTDLRKIIKTHGKSVIEEFRGKVLIEKVLRILIGHSSIQPAVNP